MVIWKKTKEIKIFIIGELTYENNEYKFKYIDSEMEILEKTKGSLLTDNFEFVSVFDKKKID